MTKLAEFPPENSSSELIEAWEDNFYNIFEDISAQYLVCDELDLVREFQQFDSSASERDISEYTLKIDVGDSFPTPEQINNIEKGLQGSCFRTDGPDIFWESFETVPVGPWKGSIAIIGPPLNGDTYEEIQNGKFWIPWSDSLDRLIHLCEENGINIIYPQDIGIGTTLWSGNILLAGIAITIYESVDKSSLII